MLFEDHWFYSKSKLVLFTCCIKVKDTYLCFNSPTSLTGILYLASFWVPGCSRLNFLAWDDITSAHVQEFSYPRIKNQWQNVNSAVLVQLNTFQTVNFYTNIQLFRKVILWLIRRWDHFI